VKCSQLVVIAPDHKVVDVSNGTSEIVARVGGLPGMPYHLQRSGSSLELRKAELVKAWALKKQQHCQCFMQAGSVLLAGRLKQKNWAHQPIPVKDSQLLEICYFRAEVP